MPHGHVQEHIDLIAKHEQDFLIRRTKAEKLSDGIAGFFGSLESIAIHMAVFAAWVVLKQPQSDPIAPLRSSTIFSSQHDCGPRSDSLGELRSYSTIPYWATLG